MKTIKSALFAVLATFALTTASSAASLNGVYLELGSSAIGVELDGNHNDTTGNVTTGQLGKTAVTLQYGFGFMTSRANKVGLDLGYMFTPGEAQLKTTSDHDNSAGNVTFELSDTIDYYAAPMINMSEDASLYLKIGRTESDLKVTGDVTKPTSMEGTTLALGTVMSWGSNLYIRTEAGKTDYDTLTSTGLGTSCGASNSGCIATTTKVTADPTVHYGKIAIGYKF